MKVVGLLLNSLLALDRRSAIATGSTGLSSVISTLSNTNAQQPGVMPNNVTEVMKPAGPYLESLLGLENRVAVVTGSTGGLGRAIVETLAKSGCRVVVNGRYEEKTAKAAQEVIETCELDPSDVLAAHGDTSDPEQAKIIVRKIEKTFGKLDILVNNAGMNLPEGSFEDQYSPKNWDKIQKVNICGPMNMVHACLPLLRKSENGRIINLSSMIAHVGSPTNPLYSMTKSAMLSFTKSLAGDLAGNTNIRVNSISPGIFITDMNKKFTEDPEKMKQTENGVPIKRLGKAEELAGIVTLVASEAGSYMTGADITVDGGVTAI
jgi:NAD(P)-dependent dehydrogenase (short-subunit alcohol dehydrogenase family)